ncbi:MAG: ABC transporter permease [Chitinophagales bacterium]
MLASLFKLRGPLTSQQRLWLEIGGFLFLLFIWFVLTVGENPLVRPAILPTPFAVLLAYPELYYDNKLIFNVCRSIGLNLAGYTEAMLIALPVGFLIGLIPLFRGSFHRSVDAFRFVPLTAVTGLFIIWFGLGTGMKVHFLAFGILIYLLPVIVQRIDEVNDVYLKTVYTLGANKWQTIKTVYAPSVFSRLSDDVRVLTAISWTYIIVAESLGNQGGIGAAIWRVGERQGRVDKVFALLIIIIIIGFLQDKLFIYLDKKFFAFKYQGDKDKQDNGSVKKAILNYIYQVLFWAGIAIYAFLFLNEFTTQFTIEEMPILSYLFGNTIVVFHIYFLIIVAYKAYEYLKKARK